MDESNDSPLVTSESLTQSNLPYQKVIRSYLENNSFEKVDVSLIHQAIHDILVSDDDVADEALDYLFSAGAPTKQLENSIPFAYIAAMQWMKPKYTDKLIVLANYSISFDDNYNETSAGVIIEKRAPGLMKLIMEKATS